MDKQRYYTWELNNKNYNEIIIYEQEQEDENSYDCISHIIEQLLQEGKITETNQYNKINNIIRDIICDNTGMCKC